VSGRTAAAIALLAGAGLWLPARAVASCIEVAPEVVTLRIEGCEEIGSYRDRRLEKAALPWLVEVAVEVVARHPGLVLTGTVIEAQEILWEDDGSAALGAFRVASERGTWFLESAAPARCEAWSREESAPEIRLVRHTPCCDVIPPYDVPCLFGVGLVTEAPPAVAELLR